jgi:hypothetical protein
MAEELDLDRYPTSLGSFLNDQWRNRAELFPAERDYIQRLVAALQQRPAAFFDALLAAEKQMGVNGSNWPRGRFTLAQVDFLNRNPHYAVWRSEIARIFSVVDPELEQEVRRKGRPRLIIVSSPADLPVGPDRMWKRIDQKGRRVPIQALDDAAETLPVLLGTGADNLLDRVAAAAGPYAAWNIEAGQTLTRLSQHAQAVRLSYDALAGYRARLMKEVQQITETERIAGPRELSARLKQLRLIAGESELARDAVLAEFLRSSLLAGNGTLLVNNTFVEWSAVQALRRARPIAAAIGFGIRNKTKPFSSMLIYSDQDQITPIPTQADMLGSYIDLEMLHLYLWREPAKYAEYHNNTVMLYVGEGMDEALVIAPPDFPLWTERLSLSALHQRLRDWLQV